MSRERFRMKSFLPKAQDKSMALKAVGMFLGYQERKQSRQDDIVKAGMAAQQQKIKNERADRNVAVQAAYLDIAQEKHELSKLTMASDSQRRRQTNAFKGIVYQLDDDKIETDIKGTQFKYNSALSELGSRDQQVNARELNLMEGWKSEGGRGTIINGWDFANNAPTYKIYGEKDAIPAVLKDKVAVGDIMQVTPDEYYEMITAPGYVDEIHNPIGTDQDITANPFRYRRTNQLRGDMSAAKTEEKKFNRARLKLAIKHAEATGTKPGSDILIKGIPNDATVDLVSQYPRVNQLWGLTAAQKTSLMHDVERMGVNAALQMIGTQGGQGHRDWLVDFIDQMQMAPPIDLRATVNQQLLNDPAAARKLLGVRRQAGGIIEGQKQFKPKTKVDVVRQGRFIASLDKDEKEWLFERADQEDIDFIESLETDQAKREYIQGADRRELEGKIGESGIPSGYGYREGERGK